MRKSFVAAISIMLLLSVVGCGSKEASTSANNTTASGEQAKEDLKEISYWVEMNPAAIPVAQNLNEVEYFKQLEERTGVKVKFLHPPAGQGAEQFKLLIASRNDLPDVIETSWTGAYPGGPEKAIKDGIIIPLNEYIDANAPHYKSALEVDAELLKQAKTDSGTIYGFHAINVGENRGFGGLILRQDWLDDLGLENPTTISEWETVLKRFRDEKGAEYPLSLSSGQLKSGNAFNTAFGVGDSFYLDDNGQVQYGPLQPEYKEYLQLLKDWYAQGLLDPDFASLDSKAIESNILNGKSGATFGYVGGSIGKWSKAATDPNFKLIGAHNPVFTEGEEPMFLGEYSHKIRGGSAAITTAAKNPAAIAEWLDYRYTDEGITLKNYGVEGLTYDVVDGVETYTDLIMNNPEGLAIGNALAKYTQASYPGPGLCELPNYTKQYYQLEEQRKSAEIYNRYADNAGKHVMPPIVATPEESKEQANILTEITTYLDEKFVGFITGVEPLENFDAFVENLKGLGIERVVEIKQAGVERYNAR